jgi:hypothetical protein
VVELTHTSSNFIFIMCVVFMSNYFLMVGNVLIDNEALFMTDFMNLSEVLIEVGYVSMCSKM